MQIFNSVNNVERELRNLSILLGTLSLTFILYEQFLTEQKAEFTSDRMRDVREEFHFSIRTRYGSVFAQLLATMTAVRGDQVILAVARGTAIEKFAVGH